MTLAKLYQIYEDSANGKTQVCEHAINLDIMVRNLQKQIKGEKSKG
jgi:hypothetical protein